MGKVFGWQERNIGIISFPLECPRCGKETIHTYSKKGRDPTLFGRALPVGRFRPFVQCSQCGLSRPVPRGDRRKIQRLVKLDPRAFASGQDVGGPIELSLGRATADPERMRHYMPKLGNRRLVYVSALLVLLLTCPVVGYYASKVGESGAYLLVESSDEFWDSGRLRGALFRRWIARWLFSFAGNRDWEAYCLFGIGHLRLELGHNWRALRAYKASLALWTELGYQGRQAECYFYIGYARSALMNLTGALEAYDHCLSYWQETDNRAKLAIVHKHMGSLYMMLEQFPSALNSLEQALQLYEELGDDEAADEVRLWIVLVRTMIPENEGAETAMNWELALGIP